MHGTVTKIEMFEGTDKSVTFTRKRRQMDGDLFDQDRTIDIPVKAGWKAGTKLTYPGEGDEERDDIILIRLFLLKTTVNMFLF